MFRFFFITGYKKVADSLKPTAASYSFGKKHAHAAKDDTVGPGPANYDVYGLSTKGSCRIFHLEFSHCRFFCFHQYIGKVNPREISLASRPQPLKQFTTPAPGDYDVAVHSSSKMKKGYTFGHPNLNYKSSNTPGNFCTFFVCQIFLKIAENMREMM